MLIDKWELVKTYSTISPDTFQDFSFHSHELIIFQDVKGQNIFGHFTWFLSRFSFIHINLVFFQDESRSKHIRPFHLILFKIFPFIHINLVFFKMRVGQNIFEHFTWFLSRFLPGLLRAPPPLAWVSPTWAWTSRSRLSGCWTECSGSPWLTQPRFNGKNGVKQVALKSKISFD